jgi:hypothetical protein
VPAHPVYPTHGSPPAPRSSLGTWIFFGALIALPLLACGGCMGVAVLRGAMIQAELVDAPRAPPPQPPPPTTAKDDDVVSTDDLPLETAEPPKKKPPPARSTGSGMLKCCDGTLSPSCACGRKSNRGCCSHHGGVCGCDR